MPGKRKGSPAWKCFELIGTNCHCRLCSKTSSPTVLKYAGNTSNMLSHIKTVHPDLIQADQSKNQPKISSFTILASRQRFLDHELGVLCVTSCLPLNLTESLPFRRFMFKAVPGYDLPCAKTLKKNHVKPMVEKVTKKIVDDAKDMPFALTKDMPFALTCDFWSNVNQQSFLGLTCHFIKDGVKHNVTLECLPYDGRQCEHTSKNCRSFG